MAKRKAAPATIPMFDIEASEREPRRSRLRENWRPTPEQMAKARADFPTVDLDAEFEKFQDYHMGKGTTMVDWYRALRTWLRNARDWQDKDRKQQAVNRARPPRAGFTPAQPYNPAVTLRKEEPW